jgi:hypothetical protein
MNLPSGQRLARSLLFAGWTVLLALCPWWLGLALLPLLAAGTLYYARRSANRRDVCLGGLRWGLPGVLFAAQRALGGDLLAWGVALLGALLGFSLVALLESFLPRRARSASPPSPEWRDMAMASVGPPARIIELEPVAWQDAGAALSDPRGQIVGYEADSADEGRYRLAGGGTLERLGARCAFSPKGRWFSAGLPHGRGDVLLDRDRGRMHRLRGWQLCGWDESESPWLARRADGVPAPLHEALGQPGEPD